jgi:hypothetical protein
VVYLYSLTENGKALMKYDQNNIKTLCNQLFGINSILPLQYYDKFCNYGIILKKLFEKRILGLYLDVLARLENIENPQKYITGSGSTLSTYIRTCYIDYLFNYEKNNKNRCKNGHKRKRTINDNESVISNKSNKSSICSLINDETNEKYFYLGKTYDSEAAFLDSFEIDMSLFN